ncbi:YfgG family protein [Candidatus Pantoea persica]|uniref:YfgG family protein n=1 Tax=Candidatus Pantoea persica TaxID=2518128 RepID=UPI00215DA25B|nr:YfgG family protein [Candidatus Pantoea persica]MBA2817170.1 hypothetical protein [Candidatus Pantoea persica]
MNSAIPSRRRPKPRSFTRIVLLISFIILLSRMIFILPAAFEHHQQKKAAPPFAPLSLTDRDSR